MIRKIAVAALFVAVVLLTGSAIYADDAKPVPEGNASPRSAKASYFQGTWSGSWPGLSSTNTQPVTVGGGEETREKVFDVTYTWGEVTWKGKTLQAGEKTTEGREQDDKLLVQWKNKKGMKNELVLQKYEDNKVKARIEKDGNLGPGGRSFIETILYRK